MNTVIYKFRGHRVMDTNSAQVYYPNKGDTLVIDGKDFTVGFATWTPNTNGTFVIVIDITAKSKYA